MKKLLFILMTMVPLVAIADPVEIDGIYYNLISKLKIAEVTMNPNKYSGIVIIPSEVTYSGSKYRVTKISENAFLNCYSLTSIAIPNSITEINGFAFANCYDLSSVVINDLSSWCNIKFDKSCSGNNPLELAHHLFLDDKEIKDLIIPDDITVIKDISFIGCSGLSSVTIHNNVNSIGLSAFAGCSGLSSLKIPNSVTEIGHRAFAGCSGLTSIILSCNLTSIDDYVFSYCSELTSVTIPDGVKSIGYYSFTYCNSLTYVSIPSSVTTIFEEAFSYCPELLDVYCSAEILPNIKDPYYNIDRTNVFSGSYIESATLHVPESTIDTYKRTTPWNGFGKIETLDDNTIETPKCATPTISIEDGDIIFNCETEGVEYISEITTPDAKKYDNGRVNLSYKYKVSVYAIKEGYENSDTVTTEFTSAGKLGDLTGDGKVDVADHVKLSEIIMTQKENVDN